ncbi:hypothetical protein [Streptomyces sp. HUAS ZL42]|uniref:hypothetical protein n=1 Tax=Streptomyces sp. HUAS ZL42 TaxID=3231715 RepID=UPI00345F0191
MLDQPVLERSKSQVDRLDQVAIAIADERFGRVGEELEHAAQFLGLRESGGAGNVITAYGPSGIRGDSGVRALGGLPTDPGGPITHADVVEGRIPAKNGYMAPGVQIR